jgi:hypothetical protein
VPEVPIVPRRRRASAKPENLKTAAASEWKFPKAVKDSAHKSNIHIG